MALKPYNIDGKCHLLVLLPVESVSQNPYLIYRKLVRISSSPKVIAIDHTETFEIYGNREIKQIKMYIKAKALLIFKDKGYFKIRPACFER